MNAPVNPRIRVRFGKHGKVRFTSHRDVARIWERALRRVALPVAYSEGFSPRPKLSFGLALPTGCASDGEFLDVELDRNRAGGVEVGSDLCRRLDEALPAGIDVQAVTPIERGGPSLQEAVVACTWEFHLSGASAPQVDGWASGILGAEAILVERERKGKRVTDDVRPLVHDLEVLTDPGVDGTVRLRAVLGTRPRALRPSELLDAGNRLASDPGGSPAHPPVRARSVCRMHQWIDAGSGDAGVGDDDPGISANDEFDDKRQIMQGDWRTDPRQRGLVEPLAHQAAAPATPAESRA